MNKSNRIPRLHLLCLVLGLTASVNTFALSSCTGGDSGDNCRQSINGNTYDTSVNTSSVLDELQNNFSYGSSNFNGGTNLVNINNNINTASYMASRFLIQNLTLPVFNLNYLSSVHYDVAIGEASSFSAYLNNIHDVQKSYTLSNYFTSFANNGYNPITNLDIESFIYPRTGQLIKNSLNSVTPISFLNYVNATSTSPENIESTFQQFCSARNAMYSRENASAACIQPFDQFNIAAGYNFESMDGQTDNAGTRFSTTLPPYWDFIEQNTNNAVLPSITASSLLNPLTYEDDASNDQYSLPLDEKLGLYGRTELSAADNFIRYLSGDMLPSGISTSDEYQQYYNIATGSTCYQYRLDAAMKIKAYRLMLRNYAAQSSVATDNLYYLMQKRRPIQGSGNSVTKTSQMEQEYKMATYRLFNPDSTSTQKTTEWQDRLATASSAAVQRQMATLLAEINYQLFLNRKEQERILLTLSAMHLSNTNQLKKGLTLSEAATYVSPIQTSNLSTSSTCSGETLSNADNG